MLKVDGLSHNDILGFLVLIDICTISKLHINELPMIRNLLDYLNEKHPFQSILTFFFYADPSNQVYTSPLTSFDLNLLLYNIYPSSEGIIFYCVDSINDPTIYHQTISQRIASIFRPVSSLRENSHRINRSVSVEFLELIQHLLNDPQRKILVLIDENIEKILQRPFHAALMIQRGQPTVEKEKHKLKNFDVWHSLEKTNSSTVLLVDNNQMVNELLDRFVRRPYQSKIVEHKAYLYWLKKKFHSLTNIEECLEQGVDLCERLMCRTTS